MEDSFIFDYNNVIEFCSIFAAAPINKFTDSWLEVNLEDLNDRWKNLQQSYKSLCISKDESILKEIKQLVRDKYITCMKTFQRCKANLLDWRKFLVNSSRPRPSQFTMERMFIDNSMISVKISTCDNAADICVDKYLEISREIPSHNENSVAVTTHTERIFSMEYSGCQNVHCNKMPTTLTRTFSQTYSQPFIMLTLLSQIKEFDTTHLKQNFPPEEWPMAIKYSLNHTQLLATHNLITHIYCSYYFTLTFLFHRPRKKRLAITGQRAKIMTTAQNIFVRRCSLPHLAFQAKAASMFNAVEQHY